MPLMGIRLHLRLHEADHFATHRLQRFVEAAVAEMAGSGRMLHQLDQTLASLRVVRPDKRDHGLGGEHLAIASFETEIVRADDLGLAHGNAAHDLRGVFANADLREKGFNLAEALGFAQASGVRRHLLDAFNVGGEPGKAVTRVLLTLHQLAAKGVARADFRSHGHDGAPDKPLRVFRGLIAEPK